MPPPPSKKKKFKRAQTLFPPIFSRPKDKIDSGPSTNFIKLKSEKRTVKIKIKKCHIYYLFWGKEIFLK